LAERVNNPQPIYAEDYYKARELILNDIDSNDKILVIGAGTVNKLAAMLVERPIA
jgi:UDP-N-acetylmuramate-alanine ligase